jgi:hypothetical protein
MERGSLMSDSEAGDPAATPALPAWLHHARRPLQDRGTMLEHIARRDGPAPAAPSATAEAGASANAAKPSRPGGRQFAAHFITNMVFYSLIALLVSSRFPIDLGVFLFVADDAFIEWVFRKLGIRFVPDTPGPEFIKCLVFMTGWAVLLAHWTASAPAWLSPWIHPAPPWWLIAGTALFYAAAKLLATAIVKRWRARAGIAIAPDGAASLLILGAVLLSSLAVLTAASMLWDRLAG